MIRPLLAATLALLAAASPSPAQMQDEAPQSEPADEVVPVLPGGEAFFAVGSEYHQHLLSLTNIGAVRDAISEKTNFLHPRCVPFLAASNLLLLTEGCLPESPINKVTFYAMGSRSGSLRRLVDTTIGRMFGTFKPPKEVEVLSGEKGRGRKPGSRPAGRTK